MTREEIQGKVLAEEPTKVYKDLLTDQNVWYFSTYQQKSRHLEIYDEFKRFVSDKLDVHSNNVSIVGSAKTGYSLSPSKEMKSFSVEGEKPSDIDLVIVSSDYFEKFWIAYLDCFYDQRIFTIREFAVGVFKGFVSVKDDHVFHPDLRDWNIKVDDFKKDIQLRFDISHQLNYRIFRSWNHVEKYYTNSIYLLKNNFEKEILKKN